MKKTLTITIGFLHDFAAGCWAATVFAVYYLHKQNVSDQVAHILNGIQERFFYYGLIFVGIVLITGAGRSFTYTQNVYGADSESKRKKMLIYKHIMLFVIFGFGVFWQYNMIFG